MPLQETSGNVTTDAYGGGVAAVPQYIEDVFSTYLYTGTGAAQTITNGIDLSTKGGLVWFKPRTPAGYSHFLYDTSRGIYKSIRSNTTGANQTLTSTLTAFNTTGFTLGNDSDGTGINTSAITNVSWTFRKQPKFFDIVTWTGNGVANRQIAHSLGSTPGCIIVKSSSIASNWRVWQRAANVGSGDGNAYGTLNATNAFSLDGGVIWGDDATVGYVAPTSTNFTVSANSSVNSSGNTYVAYIYAHNAGGFGLTDTDNVISCGSYATDASGIGSATLGWEPQWLLLKVSSGTGGWVLIDNMRGFVAPGGGNSANLLANDSASEQTVGIKVNATGFTDPGVLVASGTVIYIAIRRGPMKVPTVGTSVFAPVSRAGTYTVTPITAGFAPDLIVAQTSNLTYGAAWWDKLRGALVQVRSYTTAAENTSSGSVLSYDNTGVTVGLDGNEWINGVASGNMYANWIFQRAPSFFDEVCYTGTGVARTLTHNLAAVPEMMIVKNRTLSSNWTIYTATTGNGYAMNFDTAVPFADGGVVWNSTTPTSTVFSVGTNDRVNGISSNPVYVAYLFATCAGVSKVGSYTGNGTTQTINCGFTGGARFVLIKRTDSTGDWYVYDTARGMTVLTDPYLLINSQTAQTATLGSVTTVSTGFALNSTILAAINVNGGSYIFLAIA
jgi:hypothetical protein